VYRVPSELPISAMIQSESVIASVPGGSNWRHFPGRRSSLPTVSEKTKDTAPDLASASLIDRFLPPINPIGIVAEFSNDFKNQASRVNRF
jgi:hypothetical protein